MIIAAESVPGKRRAGPGYTEPQQLRREGCSDLWGGAERREGN